MNWSINHNEKFEAKERAIFELFKWQKPLITAIFNLPDNILARIQGIWHWSALDGREEISDRTGCAVKRRQKSNISVLEFWLQQCVPVVVYL